MIYCGKRVRYYKNHTGLCARPPHGDEVDHLVEVVSVDTKRVDYTKGGAVPDDIKSLREHQQIALEKLKNGSVLNGGVGSGKTITALAYFVEKVCNGALDRSVPCTTPKKLIVITTARKRDDLDWDEEALHFGIFPNADLSYTGHEMIVDSWQNIQKYAEVEDAFFIFDEQKVVGSGKWVKAFLKIAKSNEWILLSATPADTWIDYVPLFIANGFYRNRTEFVEDHVVWSFHGKYRKIRGFFGVKKLERYRDQILVDMPFERHTTRHIIEIPVRHDEELFKEVWRRRWNVYTNEPLIDVAEMHRIGRRVVNEDPSRLLAIENLLKKHNRLIIFYTFDYELEALRTLMTELDIVVAEWNGHRHEPVPETERWLYLVQYQAGSEAWNCTTTNAIVFYSLTYSHKLYEQSQGRIDRMDTPYDDLWYYVLKSDAKIDQIIWRALSTKKNFHEGRNIKFNAEPRKMAA